MKNLPELTILPGITHTRRGALNDLFTITRTYGPRGRIVHSASFARNGGVNRSRKNLPADVAVDFRQGPSHEPTLDDLRDLVTYLEQEKPDWVAGIGGGSILDLVKAATGLIGAPAPMEDYYDAKNTFASRVPFIAVPTTAGTGAEATPASVFINGKARAKKAIVNAHHVPRVVILDADLLAGCPKQVIAASGMDAFTQSIEAFMSRFATVWTDEIARQSIFLVRDNLGAFYADSISESAEAMLIGSYLSGVALANAKLGLVHGIAHPIGQRTHAAHGLICAVLLPHVLQFNKSATEAKYALLAQWLGEDPVVFTEKWIARFGLISPVRVGHLEESDRLVKDVLDAASTKANPRQVTPQDVMDITRLAVVDS
jgi:alcohol dehydrogenase class IV